MPRFTTAPAQVQNNTRVQVMRARLPAAAVQDIFEAMNSHQSLATRLVCDEETRQTFVDVVYELPMGDRGAGLIQASHHAYGVNGRMVR